MNAFTEPHVYRLSKSRLVYSVVAVVFIAVASFLDIKNFSLTWLTFLTLLVLYLFIPFLYRLIVSHEAISSINLLGTRTLDWNEIAEIKPKNSGLFLVNRDDSVKVFINSQIDNYPEVIKFIQQKRPDLWKSQEIAEFHQSIVESILLLVMGAGFLALISQVLFQGDPFGDEIVPLLMMFAACIFTVWKGLSKIRGLSLENDRLIIKYIFWKRQYQSKAVKSVGLEQEMDKNQINYPVHIRLENGKQIVIERVKEGNPILVNVLEQWLQKYKTTMI